MSVLFLAHAALLDLSSSSRTNLYAPDTQNSAPCLNKKYSLIQIRVLGKVMRLILKEITRANHFVLNRVFIK